MLLIVKKKRFLFIYLFICLNILWSKKTKIEHTNNCDLGIEEYRFVASLFRVMLLIVKKKRFLFIYLFICSNVLWCTLANIEHTNNCNLFRSCFELVHAIIKYQILFFMFQFS